jgi:hypothetical protein
MFLRFKHDYNEVLHKNTFKHVLFLYGSKGIYKISVDHLYV